MYSTHKNTTSFRLLYLSKAESKITSKRARTDECFANISRLCACRVA